MGLHDALADGQPQAGAARRVALPAAGERAAQARQVLGRYAAPLVGHRDLDLRARLRGRHLDRRRRGRVPGRVGEQVADDLDDAPAVGHHGRQVAGHPLKGME